MNLAIEDMSSQPSGPGNWWWWSDELLENGKKTKATPVLVTVTKDGLLGVYVQHGKRTALVRSLVDHMGGRWSKMDRPQAVRNNPDYLIEAARSVVTQMSPLQRMRLMHHIIRETGPEIAEMQEIIDNLPPQS